MRTPVPKAVSSLLGKHSFLSPSVSIWTLLKTGEPNVEAGGFRYSIRYSSGFELTGRIEGRTFLNEDCSSHLRRCFYKGSHLGVGRNDFNRDAGSLQGGCHYGAHGRNGCIFAQGGEYIGLEAEIVGDRHEMVELD